MNYECFYNRLNTLYSTGNTKDIEKFLFDQIANTDSKKNTPFLSIAYNELGSLYRSISKFSESIDAFDKSLNLLIIDGMEYSSQYYTVLLNKAGALYMSDNKSEAEKTYMDILEGIDILNPDLYYNVINNLSLLYLDTDRVDDALKYELDALNYLSVFCTEKIKLATTLSNISSIYLKKEMLDDAEQYALKSINVFESEEENPHFSEPLNVEGTICFKNKKYKEASSYYEKSIKITKSYYGENHNYATGMINLSLSYYYSGNIEKAFETISEANDIMISLFGENDPHSVSCRKILERIKENCE